MKPDNRGSEAEKPESHTCADGRKEDDVCWFDVCLLLGFFFFLN